MGAFEKVFGPVRGEFEQKFFKNSNARRVARRFDWYIIQALGKAFCNKVGDEENVSRVVAWKKKFFNLQLNFWKTKSRERNFFQSKRKKTLRLVRERLELSTSA